MAPNPKSGKATAKKKTSDRPKVPDKFKNKGGFSSSSGSADGLPDAVHGVGGRYNNANDVFNGQLLAGTPYRLGQRIGGGNFGEIRMVRHIKTNEQLAAKLEPDNIKPSQLLKEWEFYNVLNKTPAVGIAKALHYGRCGLSTAMVFELLGPSLEQIFAMCERKFSLHTVLMLAVQLITRLEYVHSCRIINQDIKPDNFLISKPPKRDPTVFITDFGLSKYYMDPVSGAHIPHRHIKSFVGTPRYVSLNMHMGIEQSRRDDLESLGYTLIYFLRGSLPWQGYSTEDSPNPYKTIMDMKRNINLPALCKEEQEFVDYMQYVRKLGFEQNPDYAYLRNLFLKRMQKDKLDPAGEMDWASKTADKARMRMLQRLNA